MLGTYSAAGAPANTRMHKYKEQLSDTERVKASNENLYWRTQVIRTCHHRLGPRTATKLTGTSRLFHLRGCVLSFAGRCGVVRRCSAIFSASVISLYRASCSPVGVGGSAAAVESGSTSCIARRLLLVAEFGMLPFARARLYSRALGPKPLTRPGAVSDRCPREDV